MAKDPEPQSPSPRERAEKIVGDLAKRGESRTKGIQKAARELADRSARDRDDLMRLLGKEIRAQRKRRAPKKRPQD
jgi:hypothetical protein